jgi:hypothetical protein
MGKQKHPQRTGSAKRYMKPILTKEKQLREITSGATSTSRVPTLGYIKQLHTC